MGVDVTVKQAIEHLKQGKTLLYPTDTIWGIGCDATNGKAIDNIKKIKQRSPNKSFIILVDSVAMLERYVLDFPDVCYDLIDYALHPLTIIYDHPQGLPKELLAENGSLGIRVTKDKFCRQIIQGLRKPLVSTSANLSGEATGTCFNDINQVIKDEVDIILDERKEEVRTTPSKIIKIKGNGTISFIRK